MQEAIEAKLVVQENGIPKFYKPRSVPYAICGGIEKDLERLENLGVIEEINYTTTGIGQHPSSPCQKLMVLSVSAVTIKSLPTQYCKLTSILS